MTLHPLDHPGRRWGGPGHRLFSVVVFIALASLDNVAIALVPPLYSGIGAGLGVPVSAIGLATAVSFVLSSVSAVAWAYVGDRGNRRPLLAAGTLIWAAGTAGTAVSTGYPGFLAAQAVAAVGLGAVGSVGFSVVTDLVAPARRGLVLSLWGLSQGAGTIGGLLTGGLLGAADWRRPFWVVTALGVAATGAYLLTCDIRPGQSDPELARLFATGQGYQHRISLRDLGPIARRRTNLLLILQGLTAQVTFGSLLWLPHLLRARAEAQGYPGETATAIGSLYAALFQLGGVLSIIGGLVGDRVQRRVPGGRALVAGIGVAASVPVFGLLFFIPVRVTVPAGGGTLEIAKAVLRSVGTEPTVTVTFLAAILALALVSANAPNWFALVADVNPPEHRGSVYSVVNLVNGAGRAVGNGLAGVAFRTLAGPLPPPANYATGLALFQLFLIPTAGLFLLAARTARRDLAEVTAQLRQRAGAGLASGPGGDQAGQQPADGGQVEDPA